MEKTTLTKNQKADITTKTGGKYSYQYVDIAQIHDYLGENGMKYIQCIKRIENEDYVMTKRFVDGKWEDEWLQGSRVVQATLVGNNNPAQEQGSALTYARRYSLLMAFGLATEDGDAQSLSRDTSNQKTKVILATESQINTIKGILTEEQIKHACDLVKKNKLEEFTIQEASNLISNIKKENK